MLGSTQMFRSMRGNTHCSRSSPQGAHFLAFQEFPQVVSGPINSLCLWGFGNEGSGNAGVELQLCTATRCPKAAAWMAKGGTRVESHWAT